jgi:hypothetical protein
MGGSAAAVGLGSRASCHDAIRRWMSGRAWPRAHPSWRSCAGDPVLAIAAGLAVAAVAAVDLALAIAGGGLRIGPDMAATTLYLMPTPTALCLMLASSALALSRFEPHDLAAAVLAGIAIAVLVLLGYLQKVSCAIANGTCSSPSPRPSWGRGSTIRSGVCSPAMRVRKNCSILPAMRWSQRS